MSVTEWGSVAAWTSAFLSSGSTSLALYIILRDRTKAESEQARKVVITMEGDNRWNRQRVTNGSDKPLYNFAVWCRMRNFSSYATEAWPLVELGAGKSLEYQFTWSPKRERITPEYLTFRDAQGKNWVLEIDTMRLLRPRKGFPRRPDGGWKFWIGHRKQERFIQRWSDH